MSQSTSGWRRSSGLRRGQGCLDVLVNNAPSVSCGAISEMSLEAIAPGVINTPLTAAGFSGLAAEHGRKIAERVPLGKVVAPVEGLRPEAQLLLYLARTVLHDDARLRTMSLLVEDLDWEYFVRLTNRQRVVPLVHRCLDGAGLSPVPGDPCGV